MKLNPISGTCSPLQPDLLLRPALKIISWCDRYRLGGLLREGLRHPQVENVHANVNMDTTVLRGARQLERTRNTFTRAHGGRLIRIYTGHDRVVNEQLLSPTLSVFPNKLPSLLLMQNVVSLGNLESIL